MGSDLGPGFNSQMSPHFLHPACLRAYRKLVKSAISCVSEGVGCYEPVDANTSSLEIKTKTKLQRPNQTKDKTYRLWWGLERHQSARREGKHAVLDSGRWSQSVNEMGGAGNQGGSGRGSSGRRAEKHSSPGILYIHTVYVQNMLISNAHLQSQIRLERVL